MLEAREMEPFFPTLQSYLLFNICKNLLRKGQMIFG